MARRQAHNEGSITERKNKDDKVISYQAQLSLPGGGRRSATFKTKREARRWLTENKAALLQGRLLASRSQTVCEYLDGWLRTVRSSLKDSTYDTYARNVRRVAPHIGKIRLDALKPAHIQECYNALQERGLHSRTIRQVHLTLHKALKDAIRLDLVGRNVTEGATLPRLPHTERPYYTLEELGKLLESTSGDRFHALWVVLGTTGLRLGEALGLMWDDIEYGRGTLSVQRSLYRARAGGGLAFAEPKSKRSRRTVDLSQEALVALKAHEERQIFERRKAASAWHESKLVFPSEVGTPLEQGRVHKHWSKAVEKAGIPRYRIYDLRHTVATHLTMAGMSAREVAEILGHSNASLVLEVYGHVAPSTQRKAANLMDTLLRQHRSVV